jgi:arginyl-tRNA synthetase
MSQQIDEALGKLDLMIASASTNAAGGAAEPASAAVAPAPPAPAAEAQGSIRQRLSAAFQASLDGAFPAAAGEPAIVMACNNPKFGDYQCNNAMALFGKLKGQVGGWVGGG